MKIIFVVLLFSVINCFGQPLTQTIPQDKQQHFAVGAAVAGVVYITAWDYYHQQNPLTAHAKATKVTLLSNITMAVLKELYDYQKAKRLNTWNKAMRIDSYEDILATWLGCATVTLAIRIGAGK
jgi:uncharacterized protein YfiM (DUF2279 family)